MGFSEVRAREGMDTVCRGTGGVIHTLVTGCSLGAPRVGWGAL